MEKYIGISEDRLKHILGVARECYNIAKKKGYNEDFCRRMFMIGWNHDVGYEFAENQLEHPIVSEELLHLINVDTKSREAFRVLHSIKNHDSIANIQPIEWVILVTADLTIDNEGNKVSIEERLEDIKNRYGEKSRQYINSETIGKYVGLIKPTTKTQLK